MIFQKITGLSVADLGMFGFEFAEIPSYCRVYLFVSLALCVRCARTTGSSATHSLFDFPKGRKAQIWKFLTYMNKIILHMFRFYTYIFRN